MRVCVMGLWHLGTVTAACLASRGHRVVGLHDDARVVDQLAGGKPPLFEPGLEELLKQGIASGMLTFTADAASALADADVLWVAYDTPVDDDDRADVAFVTKRIRALFPLLRSGMTVLVSSQVPVGTTAALEAEFARRFPGTHVGFACSPENLRLGKAIGVFLQPDRIVVGVRAPEDRERIAALLRPVTERIEWMSVESAEMTKHAVNAFLALSVTFANEIAVLCEQVGADAKEVERGLKSEQRIGPGAYVAPGSAFAGGTLARDVAFLADCGAAYELPGHLFRAIKASNDAHRTWVQRKLADLPGGLRGRRIAIWGLTYKPGTDTLRRSSSVELATWLAEQGALVAAHDPAVRALPPELAGRMELCAAPIAALGGAAALVVATEWPVFRSISADEVVAALRTPVVVDPNRFLALTLGVDARIQYAAVGQPSPRNA